MIVLACLTDSALSCFHFLFFLFCSPPLQRENATANRIVACGDMRRISRPATSTSWRRAAWAPSTARPRLPTTPGLPATPLLLLLLRAAAPRRTRRRRRPARAPTRPRLRRRRLPRRRLRRAGSRTTSTRRRRGALRALPHFFSLCFSASHSVPLFVPSRTRCLSALACPCTSSSSSFLLRIRALSHQHHHHHHAHSTEPEFEVLQEFKGATLKGKRYTPLFNYFVEKAVRLLSLLFSAALMLLEFAGE